MNSTIETIRLAKLGMPQLVQLTLRGKLRGKHVGLAVEGASDFFDAIKDGDIASDEDQYDRAMRCATCPNVTRHGFTIMGFGRLKWYCGDPFDPDPAKGTCGCTVGTSESRQFVKTGKLEHPGAKLWVASEKCGAGRFGPVDRAVQGGA